MSRIVVATAGWSVPRVAAHEFPATGSHLQRYARRLAGVEINSSFYRPHRRSTYSRWADTTPEAFQFAVKVPRTITHDLALRRVRSPLAAFVDETGGLGAKRGPLLIQLPPSAVFEPRVAAAFFAVLRDLYDGPAVCEPRHPTWFGDVADTLLRTWQVARVAADPAVVPAAGDFGGWRGLRYVRWHGSPRIYWSPYPQTRLQTLAATLRADDAGVTSWCVFDNTAAGAAALDAVALVAMLGARGTPSVGTPSVARDRPR